MKRHRPNARFDCMGLLLLLDRAEVIGIDDQGADLRHDDGSPTAISAASSAGVSPWDLARQNAGAA